MYPDLIRCGVGKGGQKSHDTVQLCETELLYLFPHIFMNPHVHCAVCIHVYMHIYIQPISVLFTRATRAICPDKGGILPPLSALSALPPSSSPPWVCIVRI